MEPTLFLRNVGSNSNRTMFLITLSSSIFCATFGIAKFMKLGPCRIVSDDGLVGGYAKLGFLLLMVNVCSTLLSKGFLVLFFVHGDWLGKDAALGVISWITINYVPHLIYVSTFLCFIS